MTKLNDTTLTIPAYMAVTVSQALLSPIIDRLKAWRVPPAELVDYIAPLACEPHERALMKLSREVIDLATDDATLDAGWAALVATYVAKTI